MSLVLNFKLAESPAACDEVHPRLANLQGGEEVTYQHLGFNVLIFNFVIPHLSGTHPGEIFLRVLPANPLMSYHILRRA